MIIHEIAKNINIKEPLEDWRHVWMQNDKEVSKYVKAKRGTATNFATNVTEEKGAKETSDEYAEPPRPTTCEKKTKPQEYFGGQAKA